MPILRSRRQCCPALGRVYDVSTLPCASPPRTAGAKPSALHLPSAPASALKPLHDCAPAHLRLPALQAPMRHMGTRGARQISFAELSAVPHAHGGGPDISLLRRLAYACRGLSLKHPERQRLEQRITSLQKAPSPACRAVVLDIAEALGIDASLPAVLQCAADGHAPLRQRARNFLNKSGHAYSLAQAMLLETEDFEVQYGGIRLLHAIVPCEEAADSPRVHLLKAHLTAWQQHGAAHYRQAADTIVATRRSSYVISVHETCRRIKKVSATNRLKCAGNRA